jgi:hypothetical protein
LLPASTFFANPYNDTINQSDDPLAGERAFSGSNEGSLSGSWGQSQVYLSPFAGSGDQIQLRFEMGLDGCFGRVGWYVDDVHVYSCSDVVGIACGPAPATGCRSSEPLGSSLLLKDGTRDRLVWKISKGDATSTADFLFPLGDDREVSLCLYDSSGSEQPLRVAEVAGGGLCGSSPCWKVLGGDGYKYRSRTGAPAGITLIKLQPGGAGDAKLQVKASGGFFAAPAPPLTPPVTVQLVIAEGVVQNCWQTELAFPILNQPGTFKARGP